MCRYRQRAQVLSTIHKDQPGHPVTRAVYWISYLLRHNGASHLRSSVYSVPTYQYFLLDVVLAMGLGFALIGYILMRIGRLLRSKFGGQGSGAATVAGDSDDTDSNLANGHCHSNGVANGKHKRNGALRNEKKTK